MQRKTEREGKGGQREREMNGVSKRNGHGRPREGRKRGAGVKGGTEEEKDMT